MFGDFGANDLKYLKQAMVADYFRGRHSTGLACIKPDEVIVHKEVLNPIDFMELPKVDKQLTVNHLAYIGHNRHATLGGISRDNAHPFTHGDITLAHNGTLDNKRALESKFLSSGTFDTDSELVCFMLDNFKAKTVVEALEGAFALTWWDAGSQTMNLVRNDERPLSVVVFEKKVLWGSEAKMVSWLIDRNNLDVGKFKQFELEVGEHLEIKLDKTILIKRTKYELQETSWKAGNYGVGGYNYNSYYNERARANRNRSHYVGGVVDRFDAFNQKHGTSFFEGQWVYAWLTEVKQRPQDTKHCDLVFTIATDPYCDLKCYHITYDAKKFSLDVKDNDAPYGFKLKLTGIGWESGAPKYLLVSGNDVVDITTESGNKELSEWTVKHCKDNQKGKVIKLPDNSKKETDTTKKH